MPRTNWTDMARYRVALPNNRLSEAFSRMNQSCIKSMLLGIHQSRALAAQRDVLLPKLVSGEMRMDVGVHNI